MSYLFRGASGIRVERGTSVPGGSWLLERCRRATSIKMDKLQQLITIVDTVQTLKLSDLIVDQKYSVDRLKAVDTNFGRRLLAYLDGEFCVFLPCRFGTLTDEDMCELNNEKLLFTCAGVKPGSPTVVNFERV
uniref:Uncharacterized protein n=1 Tax=Timema monikensis TaxID=170555 RepID=A0A7R9EHP1_9NEOP|nr:unnamed protein product [Timema monikensis]